MKRLLSVLVLLFAVGAASYAFFYRRSLPPVITPDGTDAELAWLKTEFALDDAQYAKVLALHNGYRPICADHCQRYMAAHDRLRHVLAESSGWSSEAESALAEQSKVQNECHASMLKYAAQVAACMNPDEGRRYMEMIRLQLLDGDPAGMFAKSR